MRRRMVVWMATVLLATVGMARATSPGALDRAGLEAEAAHNSALKHFLRHNGLPDAAEVRPIFDEVPWDNYEVAIYYFGQHRAYGFARARILSQPTVQTHRFEHTLSDADIQSLQAHLPPLRSPATASCGHSAVARAECAADQAERAAQRVDVAAVRAERAADRTESIVEKMAASAPRARQVAARHASQP